MTQLTRCKCGHVLLLHVVNSKGDKCKHPNCKCKAFKQEGKCERSAQPGQRRAHRVDRLASFLELPAYEMRDDLGICISGENGTREFQLFSQILMIFYDAIVNDRYAINGVRMSVFFIWTAVGRPTRVANPCRASEWVSS